jgi:hypothetical protein
MKDFLLKSTLSSRKFWFALIGSVLGTVAYKLTDDGTFAIAILGAFGIGIGGNILEDSIAKNKTPK